MIWAIAQLNPEFWCPGWLLGAWSVIRNPRVDRKMVILEWNQCSTRKYNGACTRGQAGLRCVNANSSSGKSLKQKRIGRRWEFWWQLFVTPLVIISRSDQTEKNVQQMPWCSQRSNSPQFFVLPTFFRTPATELRPSYGKYLVVT